MSREETFATEWEFMQFLQDSESEWTKKNENYYLGNAKCYRKKIHRSLRQHLLEQVYHRSDAEHLKLAQKKSASFPRFWISTNQKYRGKAVENIRDYRNEILPQ